MLSDKKLKKIEKALGAETARELQELSPDSLKDQIVAAESSIKHALQELESNLKYQELKESLKAVTQGLKEVKARQNAIIQYSLSLLEDKGDKNV